MSRLYQIETATLRIADCHGFTFLIRVPLETGVSPNRKLCDTCEMPLELAAAGGFSNVVLLQQEASTTGGIPCLILAVAGLALNRVLLP